MLTKRPDLDALEDIQGTTTNLLIWMSPSVLVGEGCMPLPAVTTITKRLKRGEEEVSGRILNYLEILKENAAILERNGAPLLLMYSKTLLDDPAHQKIMEDMHETTECKNLFVFSYEDFTQYLEANYDPTTSKNKKVALDSYFSGEELLRKLQLFKSRAEKTEAKVKLSTEESDHYLIADIVDISRMVALSNPKKLKEFIKSIRPDFENFDDRSSSLLYRDFDVSLTENADGEIIYPQFNTSLGFLCPILRQDIMNSLIYIDTDKHPLVINCLTEAHKLKLKMPENEWFWRYIYRPFALDFIEDHTEHYKSQENRDPCSKEMSRISDSVFECFQIGNHLTWMIGGKGFDGAGRESMIYYPPYSSVDKEKPSLDPQSSHTVKVQQKICRKE